MKGETRHIKGVDNTQDSCSSNIQKSSSLYMCVPNFGELAFDPLTRKAYLN